MYQKFMKLKIVWNQNVCLHILSCDLTSKLTPRQSKAFCKRIKRIAKLFNLIFLHYHNEKLLFVLKAFVSLAFAAIENIFLCVLHKKGNDVNNTNCSSHCLCWRNLEAEMKFSFQRKKRKWNVIFMNIFARNHHT